MNFDQYLNRYLWMSVVFLILHGLITHNPVEVICAIVVTGAYLRFDALMNVHRVFYHDRHVQALTDANSMLKHDPKIMQSIANVTNMSVVTIHNTLSLPVHNCDCSSCQSKRYEHWLDCMCKTCDYNRKSYSGG